MHQDSFRGARLMRGIMLARRTVIRYRGHTVSDTFTRADSANTLGATTTGQTWFTVRGTWGITNNAAYSVTRSDDDVALVNTGAVDQRVSSTITFSGTGASIVARSDGTQQNCYVLFAGSGSVQGFVRLNGTYTSLGLVSTPLVSGNTIELDTTGSTITAKVNGSTVATWNNSSVATGTYAGLRQGGTGPATWDNFTVN